MRTISLVAVILGLGAASAVANPDLKKIQSALASSADAAGRIAQVPRIVAIGGARAASLLSHLVSHDGDLRVRIEAAKGLGKIEAENATKLIVDHLEQGGTRGLRHALRTSLAARADGSTQALAAIGKASDAGASVLLLHALQALRDQQSFDVLVQLVRSEREDLRMSAMTALVNRRDQDEKRLAVLARLLTEARATSDVLQLLDVLEGHLHATMKPALKRHASSLEPAVREAAEFLLRQLTIKQHMAAKAKAKRPAPVKDPDSRYAKPKGDEDDETDDPPGDPDPQPKTRFDLVYAFDATGSARAGLPTLRERIRAEMDLLLRSGASLRVGVLAYRGGHSPEGRKRLMDVLPLTFDTARVLHFLETVEARGTDDRGAAVAPALREALDRMPWRWRARRTVQIFADSDVDDPQDAARVVRQHFQTDRTRTRIAYMLRTRTKVPRALHDLARLGGTAVVERMK